MTGRSVEPQSAPASGYALRGLQGRVIEEIGRAIVGERYRPGDILPREDELCTLHGVSRTTIRSAMTVLEAKGLVDIRPKIGTRVRARESWGPFDPDLLRWAYQEHRGTELLDSLVELRNIIEPAAARLAATRATITDLGPLEQAVSGMASSIDDPVAYREWDVSFHLAVYAASRNPLLSQFGTLVADCMRLAFDIQQDAARGGATDVSITEDAARHAQVFNAINRGDGESAAAAMFEVVLDGKNALVAAITAHNAKA